MLGAKPVNTPIEQNHGINGDSGELLNDIQSYQRLVGRLLFLTITYPDVAYAFSIAGRFIHAPRTGHLNALHRI